MSAGGTGQMYSPVMARMIYGLDWPCTQGRSGPADTVFQSVFRQFGRAVDAQSAANRIHPTAKPVELIERALLNSSKAGDVVSDLFGGSGSTLIGCERRERHARLMEIDPKYGDCIVRRFQEYTGQQAVLEG